MVILILVRELFTPINLFVAILLAVCMAIDIIAIVNKIKVIAKT